MSKITTSLMILTGLATSVFNAGAHAGAEPSDAYYQKVCATANWQYSEIVKRRAPSSADPEGTVSVAGIGVLSCQGNRPYSVTIANGAYTCSTEATKGMATTRICEVPLFAKRNVLQFSVKEEGGATYTASYEFDLRARTGKSAQ